MSDQQIRSGKLSIHTENIFPIIKKWLYSEHDIFLRELISNAVDALQKRIALDPELPENEKRIEIKVNKKKKILEVHDQGIGMSAAEVKKYINQIAFSGAEDFINKYKDKQANIIGHFGLGFYSSFMVAEKVTIDTLSWKKGSQPAFWSCLGDTEYELAAGKRDKPGTTVTVYLNKDSQEYLEDAKIKELIEKYSNFMPFPIYFKGEVINQQSALWSRKPTDVQPDEYREFYKKMFHEFRDPLFWIHLNVDFPFNLKGILYFPKISNQLDLQQGKVKLFCNNVFVADDLKQIIPEFLLLLRGGIDIPDIPLNVSRSFLQQDQQVKKISQYIIKKMADSLQEIFKEDRKRYEEIWEDISLVIKYGILSDDKFSDLMKEIVIFKSNRDDYVTVQEYLDRNQSESKPVKIYYAPSEDLQVSYLKLMQEQGLEIIYANPLIDSHLFQHLEMKLKDISFVRVDAEINENLLDKERKEIADASDRTPSEKIREIFDQVLNGKIEASFNKDSYGEFLKKYPQTVSILAPFTRTQDDFTYIRPYDLPPDVRQKLGKDAFSELMKNIYLDVTTEVKYLKSKEIPAMIVFNEFMRRFQEMNYLSQQKDNDFLRHHTLVVNSGNELINKIIGLHEAGEKDKVELLVNYVHELALLEQKQFSGKELHSFVEKTQKILALL